MSYFKYNSAGRKAKANCRYEYEQYLNETTSPTDSFWMGGKFRSHYYNANKYGTALRKYDPIAFEVGYQDWKRERQ